MPRFRRDGVVRYLLEVEEGEHAVPVDYVVAMFRPACGFVDFGFAANRAVVVDLSANSFPPAAPIKKPRNQRGNPELDVETGERSLLQLVQQPGRPVT